MCHDRALLGFVLATAAYGLSLAISLSDYECVWLDALGVLLAAASAPLLVL